MPLDCCLSDHGSEHSCNSFKEDGVSDFDGGNDYGGDNSDYTSDDSYTDSDSGMYTYDHELHFRIVYDSYVLISKELVLTLFLCVSMYAINVCSAAGVKIVLIHVHCYSTCLLCK